MRDTIAGNPVIWSPSLWPPLLKILKLSRWVSSVQYNISSKNSKIYSIKSTNPEHPPPLFNHLPKIIFFPFPQYSFSFIFYPSEFNLLSLSLSLFLFLHIWRLLCSLFPIFPQMTSADSPPWGREHIFQHTKSEKQRSNLMQKKDLETTQRLLQSFPV